MIPIREQDMNNNTFVHKYLKPLINKSDSVIDMTLGNGNDTLLLAELSKKVYAFDISKEAIKRSKLKLNNYDNVEFINDNHINVDKYVNENIKLVIFNLGYLPNSDDKNITKAGETLIAFKKTYELLNDGGYLIITFYLGHKGGKDELYLLNKCIIDNNINIIETYKQDKLYSPITYIIKKSSLRNSS